MGMGVVAFWRGWWVCLRCRWLLLVVLEWRPVVVRAVESVGWIAVRGCRVLGRCLVNETAHIFVEFVSERRQCLFLGWVGDGWDCSLTVC